MLLSHFLSFYKGAPNEQSARECYLAVENALWEEGILTPTTLMVALATVRVVLLALFSSSSFRVIGYSVVFSFPLFAFILADLFFFACLAEPYLLCLSLLR